MSGRNPECLVIGEPGAGKTLFTLALAEWLGQTQLELSQEVAAGRVVTRTWRTPEAKAALVGQGPRTTRSLQWATLSVPLGIGRGRKELVVVDSAGLPSSVSADPEFRAASAEVLRQLRRAQMVVHVVDASRVTAPGELDRQLAAYAADQKPGRYMLLANKTDLPAGRAGLRRLRRALPGVEVLAVSALQGTGLQAVGRRLRRFLLECPPPRQAGGRQGGGTGTR
ncbi:MAG: GTPase domain-containing protein [Bacillota bacterium]|nr:GTPase domain-containing protein [Bacillota bacterium]